MMDAGIFSPVDKDSCFRDPSRLEDQSEFVENTLAEVKKKLKEVTTVDDEFLKKVLLELMLAEKKCRMSLDGESNGNICVFILTMLYEYGDFPNLNYYLVLLCRKRNQLKHTITRMVDLVKDWLLNMQDSERKLGLFDAINAITAGKIFLERQRAEVVFEMARVREEEGNIKEAAKMLQELEVETFGCLSKTEKVGYILKQMRVHLMNEDYIRFFITSKKINDKLLEGDEYVQMKLTYYEYMIKYYLKDDDYFNISKAISYRLDTLFKIGDNDWVKELECLLLFLLLSPMSKECLKFMKEFEELETKKMKVVPLLSDFYKEMLSDNIITWPLSSELDEFLKSHLVFQDNPLPGGLKRYNLLYDRTVQHNVVVISRFYSRISLKRLSELTNSTIDRLEEEISNMVHMESVYASIDRLQGIVKFGKKQRPEVILNKWNKDIAALMDLVDQCSRLVQKEKMIHEARLKQIELDNRFFS